MFGSRRCGTVENAVKWCLLNRGCRARSSSWIFDGDANVSVVIKCCCRIMVDIKSSSFFMENISNISSKLSINERVFRDVGGTKFS